jgi:hypothetical protein
MKKNTQDWNPEYSFLFPPGGEGFKYTKYFQNVNDYE